MGVRKSLALGVWLLAQALGCYEICHDIRSYSLRNPDNVAQKWLYALVAICVVILYCLSALSLWKFINTHPGVVPVDWDTYVKNKNVPISHSDPQSFHPRSAVFCKECNRPRPERAYHCQQEGKCIMRFDSWSYVFSQSIGLRNGKLYLLTLFWGSLIFLFTCLACRQEMLSKDFTSAERLFGGFLFIMIYLPIGLIALATFVLFLQRVIVNRTYQEMEFTSRNPYDLGFYENLQQVLGKPTYLGFGWLFPSRVEYPDNAGLFYPVNIPVFEGKYGAMSSYDQWQDENEQH